MDVDQHVAKRVRDMRTAQGLTLERLAEISGVSRSTISSIERVETSPTAAVLDKLATALGVTLASLFSEDSRDSLQLPLSRAAQQQVWTDPESGYQRRHLSPTAYDTPLELAEITFPARKRVSFDRPAHGAHQHQLIWMLEGEMEVTAMAKTWRLQTGDCLAMAVAEQIDFYNPTRKPARYAVVITTTPPRRAL